MTDKDLKFAIKAIRQCKKLGVISLKLGTLEFELDKAAHGPALKVSRKTIDRQASKNVAQAKFDDVKDELSVMHVEDPVGFEQALVENDLDDTLPEVEPLEETQHIGIGRVI